MTDLPPNVYRVAQRTFTEISGGKVSTTAYVLRREDTLGTYFRLVHEPDSDAKRRAFERALVALRLQQADDDN